MARRGATTVLVLGPDVGAVSGVSTHVRQLLAAARGSALVLRHFQTGSEGRAAESRARMLWRLASTPVVLAWVLLRTGARVVHVNSAMEHKAFWRDLTLVVVARALRRRVIFQVHGGHLPEDFARAVPGGRRVLRRLLRLDDEVVVLASVERAAYLDLDDALSVTVVPNAIEPTLLTPVPGDGLLRDRPLRLVYVGRLAPEKGIAVAVEATAAARARGVEVELTLAGAGPAEEDLHRAVARLGLEDVVHFVGPVFGEAKTDLWRASDVFVFPTHHREGLPYALLEAMATNTLVVTTRVGGIPDVVDETQAVLVEPHDVAAVAAALVDVDAHPDRAAARVRAARTRVEDYLVDQMTADFLSLYQGRRPRRP